MNQSFPPSESRETAVVDDNASLVTDRPVPEGKSASAWLAMLIQGTSMLLIVMVVLIVYHAQFVVPNKQRFAVVDIAEVLNLKELQVTLAVQGDNSVAKSTDAFEEIARFAKDMELALADIQQECNCSLLVRAAVVKPAPGEDLTPRLKQHLGMDKLDHAQLVQQLRTAGGSGSAPIVEHQK